MTHLKILVLVAIAASAAACSGHGYWAQRIKAMPVWKQERCNWAIVSNKGGDVEAFCPKGMPYP